MRVFRRLVAVVLLVLFAAVRAADDPKQEPRGWRLTPVCAVWDGDQLFAAYSKDYSPNGYTQHFERSFAYERRARDVDQPGRTQFETVGLQERNGVFKFTVNGSHLWLVAPGDHRFLVFPVEHVQYLEYGDWSKRLLERKFGKTYARNWHQAFEYPVHSLYFRPGPGELSSSATPLPDAKFFGSDRPLTPEFQQHQYIQLVACYDLIPTGEATFVSVHLNTKFLGLRS